MPDKESEAFDQYLRAVETIAETTKDKNLRPSVRNAFGRAKSLADLLTAASDPASIEARLEDYEGELRKTLRQSRVTYRLVRMRVKADRDLAIASAELEHVQFAEEWNALDKTGLDDVLSGIKVDEINDSFNESYGAARRAIALVELQNARDAMRRLFWQVFTFRYKRLRRKTSLLAWRFALSAIGLGVFVNAIVFKAPWQLGVVAVPVAMFVAQELWIGPYIDKRTRDKRKLHLLLAIRDLSFTETDVLCQVALMNSMLKSERGQSVRI